MKITEPVCMLSVCNVYFVYYFYVQIDLVASCAWTANCVCMHHCSMINVYDEICAFIFFGLSELILDVT